MSDDREAENTLAAAGELPLAERRLGESHSPLTRLIVDKLRERILSGAIVVFALAASAFATPAILGGRRLKVASTLAYDEFLNTLNWPLGAAIAVLLLAGLVAVIVGSNRRIERRYAEVFR